MADPMSNECLPLVKQYVAIELSAKRHMNDTVKGSVGYLSVLEKFGKMREKPHASGRGKDDR